VPPRDGSNAAQHCAFRPPPSLLKTKESLHSINAGRTARSAAAFIRHRHGRVIGVDDAPVSDARFHATHRFRPHIVERAMSTPSRASMRSNR